MIDLDAIKARYDPSHPDCPVPDDWPYTSEKEMRVYRDIAELVSEIERLYKLERYTSHKYNCDLSMGAITGLTLPCSCGSSALLMRGED